MNLNYVYRGKRMAKWCQNIIFYKVSSHLMESLPPWQVWDFLLQTYHHVSYHFSAFCRWNQTKPKFVLIIEIQRSLDNLPDHVTKVHHLSKLSMLFSWPFFCICSQGNVKPFLSFISCNQRPNSMRHVPIGTPSSTWAYRTFFASLRWKLQSPLKCSLLGPL